MFALLLLLLLLLPFLASLLLARARPGTNAPLSLAPGAASLPY